MLLILEVHVISFKRVISFKCVKVQATGELKDNDRAVIHSGSMFLIRI